MLDNIRTTLFVLFAGFFVGLGLFTLYGIAHAAPLYTYHKSLIPELDSTYELGTSTKAWLKAYFDEVCIAGDCRTAWPTGGGGGSGTDTLFNWNTGTNVISTDGVSTTATTTFTSAYFTQASSTANSVFPRFTGTAATITGATTTDLFSSVLTATQALFTRATSTDFFSSKVYGTNAFFTNATSSALRATTFGVGSDFITDITGTGISIVGGALTATNDHAAVTLSGTPDYITLVGQDIVRGTVDISDDTNLSADGTEIVLTGDALSLGTSLTFTQGTSTASFNTGNLFSTYASTTYASSSVLTLGKLTFGGVSGTAWSDFCTSITGSADLCDGSDGGGVGGSDVNWSYTAPNAFISPATTTNGIIVRASSTIGDGTELGGLTVHGSGTTTGTSTVGTLMVGNYGKTAQAGILQASAFINASTSGRSGMILQNYGTGTAPEYRFIVGDPYNTNEYLAFGLTNAGATNGSTLTGLQKVDSAYLLTQSRDLILSTFAQGGNGGSIYLSASTSVTKPPQFKLDGFSGFVGLGIATTTIPTSLLTVNGDISTANLFATGTASSSALVVDNSINIFGGGAKTTANDLCVQLTGSAALCDGGDATGGAGGSISTSSIPVAGNLAYWTSDSTLSDVATGTLTETITGLQLSATRGLVGGAAIFSLTDGYTLATTSSTTEWARAYASTTALNATSPLTYTSNTGNISIQVANGSQNGYLSSTDWTIFNNKVSSSSIDTLAEIETLTGVTNILIENDIDASSELAAIMDDETGTAGSLVFSESPTFTGTTTMAQASTTALSSVNASTSNLTIGGSINIFGGGAKTSANALCVQLTGSAGLCDGDDGGGGGSSKWTDSGTFTYLTDYTDDIAFGNNATETAPFWWDMSATTSYIGNGGPGDSVITFGTGTPWTIGFDDTDDSFSIASSTSLGLFYFLNMTSTTSVFTHSTSLTDMSNDSGMRIGFGTNTYLGSSLLDHFVFSGRTKNDDWYNVSCPIPVGATAITSDTSVASGGLMTCQGWDFYEDTTATLTGFAGSGYSYGQLGTSASADGAGVFVSGVSTGWLRAPTSTPSLEVTARINTGNSTSTRYYIGYTNLAVAGGTGIYDDDITAGCYFFASSSVSIGGVASAGHPNWYATCKTSAGASTTIDTGISTTTVTSGAGQWRTFRVDMDATKATFYIKQGTGALAKVAEISTNYPSTTTLNAGLHMGRTTGSAALQFDFFGLDFWWRKFTPNL